MLEKLLALMKTGGTWRVEDLARALDTTPALVQVMLEDLARRGYLQSLSDTCDAKCSSCVLAGHCKSDLSTLGVVWTTSENTPHSR